MKGREMSERGMEKAGMETLLVAYMHSKLAEMT